MTYVKDRRVIDADSHLMEWPGFLTDYAPAAIRSDLPVIAGGSSGFQTKAYERSVEARAALVALGDDLVRKGPKWHEALGAIDPNERREALDLLGFECQVVYSSLCAPLFGITDSSLRYAAYRAHNRAMAEFCANDPRLRGVALCDLDEPDALLGARPSWPRALPRALAAALRRLTRTLTSGRRRGSGAPPRPSRRAPGTSRRSPRVARSLSHARAPIRRRRRAGSRRPRRRRRSNS